jgi:hypothetical protein
VSGVAAPALAVQDQSAWVEPDSLTSAAWAPALLGRYPMYAEGLAWVEQFVTRPHPELGRPGAVCPRLGPALRAGTVSLVAIATTGASTQDAVQAGRLLKRLFAALAPGPHWQSTALLAFFPSVPAERAADFIDGGHDLLKAEFVEHGLMLGEFHPASTVTSVHSQSLAVMRCPVQMFAVRAISPHDLLFLDQPHVSPTTRLTYLEHYRRHVGAQLSASGRADLATRIADVQRLLTSGDPL